MRRLLSLNLTPRVDAKGVDSNPCTMPEATLYRETLTLGPLGQDELDIFKAQFGGLLAAPGSEERKLMLDRLAMYVIAVRAIKHELKDIKFVGLNPEDTELGFGHIRPVFCKSGGAVLSNWQVVLTASSTYQAWLGDSITAGYALADNFGLCVTHLKSLVTPAPFMSEVAFEVGRTGILIPTDVRSLRIGDTENGVPIVPVPTLILKPEATFLATARADVAGTDEIVLGGLVIGLGKALKQTTTFPS